MASTRALCFILAIATAQSQSMLSTGKPTFQLIAGVQGKVWDGENDVTAEPDIDVVYQTPAGSPKGIVLILPGVKRKASDMFTMDEVEVGKKHCRAVKSGSQTQCLGLPMSMSMRKAIVNRGYIAMSTSSSTGTWGAGGLISDLDAGRASKAVQHVMEQTGGEELQVFVIGVKAGAFMGRMLKQISTVMPEHLLQKANLTRQELPSVHKNIACFAPQVSALQDVRQIEEDAKAQQLILGEPPRKFMKDPLGDCLVKNGWRQGKVDQMSAQLKRGFVSKKVSLYHGVQSSKLLEKSDQSLADMCPEDIKMAPANKELMEEPKVLELKEKTSTMKPGSMIQLVTELMEDRVYPPTIFVHMPRDSRGEINIAKSMCQLKKKHVRTAEVQAYPKKVTVPLLVQYGLSELTATKIYEAWTQANVIDKNGFMYRNPEGDREWKESVVNLRLQSKSAWTIEYALDMARTLYAESNMVAEHTDTIIDFCENQAIRDDDDKDLKLEKRFKLNEQCSLTQASLIQVTV